MTLIHLHTIQIRLEIIYMGSHIEMNATIWMMIGFIIFGAISSLTAAIVRNIVINVLKFHHKSLNLALDLADCY